MKLPSRTIKFSVESIVANQVRGRVLVGTIKVGDVFTVPARFVIQSLNYLKHEMSECDPGDTPIVTLEGDMSKLVLNTNLEGVMPERRIS
jgi:hypothetical protein